MMAVAITRIRDARGLRSLIVSRSASAPHTAPSASRCGSNTASSAERPGLRADDPVDDELDQREDRDACEQQGHSRGEPFGSTWTNSKPKRPLMQRWPS